MPKMPNKNKAEQSKQNKMHFIYLKLKPNTKKNKNNNKKLQNKTKNIYKTFNKLYVKTRPS